MSGILNQDLISIREAAKIVPNRPHVSTLWRWIERGCRGHRLESFLCGGQRYTTRDALENFLSAINGGSKAPRKLTAKAREKAVEQAERELDLEGV